MAVGAGGNAALLRPLVPFSLEIDRFAVGRVRDPEFVHRRVVGRYSRGEAERYRLLDRQSCHVDHAEGLIWFEATT